MGSALNTGTAIAIDDADNLIELAIDCFMAESNGGGDVADEDDEDEKCAGDDDNGDERGCSNTASSGMD